MRQCRAQHHADTVMIRFESSSENDLYVQMQRNEKRQQQCVGAQSGAQFTIDGTVERPKDLPFLQVQAPPRQSYHPSVAIFTLKTVRIMYRPLSTSLQMHRYCL
jgi:hypothetical protein